jgi:hypothetical protein
MFGVYSAEFSNKTFAAGAQEFGFDRTVGTPLFW